MNILIIIDDNSIIEHIKEKGLESHNIIYIEKISADDPSRLQELLLAVKSNAIECIFSIGFIPTISLACGALNIKYISWIISGYDKNNYDYSIKNAWNTIYVADNTLFKELVDFGVNTVRYLPLYPSVSPGAVSASAEHKAKFLVWADLPQKVGFTLEYIDELRDSSKGYITGMSVSRTHNLVNEPLYDEFADYVKPDVEKQYPHEVNSLETLGHYYDYNLLYPEIDKQLTFPYFSRIRNEWDDYGEISVITNTTSEIFTDNIKLISREELTPELLSEYEIIIFIPRFDNMGLITVDMWNMMVMGKFVMCSAKTDFDIMGEDMPYTFKNTRELENKLRYYINNEEIRNSMRERTQKKALSLGGIEDRLRIIFQ